MVGAIVRVAYPNSVTVDGKHFKMREQIGTRSHEVPDGYDLVIVPIVMDREHVRVT
jgi:hypothetical protein